MKNIVILTGAGMSAESGLETFRGSDGLWEGHKIEEVATIEGWKANPELVQNFYNVQRKRVLNALPNEGHVVLAHLEKSFNVFIITQNVDNLHERAGSSNVLHLHGIITKAQSDIDASITYEITGPNLTFENKCIYGKSLRPNVVWFGEPVLNINKAKSLCREADIFVIIGTSLRVMPASDLITEVPSTATKFIIDPDQNMQYENTIQICEKASVGIQKMLLNKIFIETKQS